jgi:PAP2 superfamily
VSLLPTAKPRPHLLGEIAIILILVKGYDYVRSFAATRGGLATSAGEWVLRIERDLHILVEPRTNHWLYHHTLIQTVAAGWYQFAHLTVTLTMVAWLYWRHSEIYRRARNALVLTNVVGLVVFVVLPVMPPRLLPSGGFFDSVADSGLGSSPKGPVAADQYAAMPSLHLAWATWTAIVGILLVRRTLRWLWVAYPLLTTLVVVSTANHYLLDAVAGALVAVGAASATGLIPWHRRRRAGSDDATTEEHAQHESAGDEGHPHGDESVRHDGADRESGRRTAGDQAGRESDVESAETTR